MRTELGLGDTTAQRKLLASYSAIWFSEKMDLLEVVSELNSCSQTTQKVWWLKLKVIQSETIIKISGQYYTHKAAIKYHWGFIKQSRVKFIQKCFMIFTPDWLYYTIKKVYSCKSEAIEWLCSDSEEDHLWSWDRFDWTTHYRNLATG